MFVVSSRNAKAFRVSKLGERDPLCIYVFHPLFIIALPLVMHRMPNVVEDCFQWIAPVVVLLLTMLMIKILRKLSFINE